MKKRLLMVNGSPKKKESVSGIYLELLRKEFPGGYEFEEISAARGESPDEPLRQYAGILFALPLYVDSLPGVLMEWMVRILRESPPPIEKGGPGIPVWALMQCGFYEGSQNGPALEILGHFCRRAGLNWQGGAGVGGGGMIQAVKDAPPKSGIRRRVSEALTALPLEIIQFLNGEPPGALEPRFVQFGMPRFVYMMGAHFGWRRFLRKNGLNPKVISARPYVS